MLKPLRNQVVLKKYEEENKTNSGIILYVENKKLPSVAVVVAKGSKVESEIKVNDKVVYKEYSGTKVTLDEIEYIVIEEEDILAVIE